MRLIRLFFLALAMFGATSAQAQWRRAESPNFVLYGNVSEGQLRERILLAGVPQDIAALEASFTSEQKLLMVIADRIDIEKQPLSDLVEAMHRHAVTRVIFAAGHSQFNRIEQAIGACEVEGVPAWLVANFIQTSIAKKGGARLLPSPNIPHREPRPAKLSSSKSSNRFQL